MQEKHVLYRNAFGHRIYSLKEILGDEELRQVLTLALQGICGELHMAEDNTAFLIAQIWRHAADGSATAFEAHLRHVVKGLVSESTLRAALDRRAALVAQQVDPWIKGDRLADIGCGDGVVAWHLAKRGKKVVLVDVHPYVDQRVNLPINLYHEGDPLPLKVPVETSLVLTVLHHAADPVRLLRSIREVTESRAVVIESVYGITGDQQQPMSSALHLLGEERQFQYASFVDWLYNHVFHDNVSIPYNFVTPRAWPGLFEQTGWKVHRTIDLGIDQPVVPEYHMLFVLDVA